MRRIAVYLTYVVWVGHHGLGPLPISGWRLRINRHIAGASYADEVVRNDVLLSLSTRLVRRAQSLRSFDFSSTVFVPEEAQEGSYELLANVILAGQRQFG